MRSMNKINGLLLALASVLASGAASGASAQFVVPSDGTDGVFHPTSDVTINLGNAKNGVWSAPADFNLQGVYDAQQWIVVYKFESVYIPEGVTVTFKNHPKNPPVVWLVQGDVRIDGRVSVDGEAAATNVLAHRKPGPGGFRGARFDGLATGGFGWGASNAESIAPAPMPGNAGCFPLIGGSGGSFSACSVLTAGAGGGGAILIASQTKIHGSGGVSSNSYPVNPYFLCGDRSGGGGGMIRLVAPEVSLGYTTATGWTQGRIRIESEQISVASSTPPYSGATLPSPFVFLRGPATPSIRIVSVAGVSASADPNGSFASPTDIVVPTGQVQIVLECTNVPPNATVTVELRSAANTGYSTVVASLQSGDTAQSTWVATGNLGTDLGYATAMARAVVPRP